MITRDPTPSHDQHQQVPRREDGAMKKSNNFSPEIRERTAGILQEHRGSTRRRGFDRISCCPQGRAGLRCRLPRRPIRLPFACTPFGVVIRRSHLGLDVFAVLVGVPFDHRQRLLAADLPLGRQVYAGPNRVGASGATQPAPENLNRAWAGGNAGRREVVSLYSAVGTGFSSTRARSRRNSRTMTNESAGVLFMRRAQKTSRSLLRSARHSASNEADRAHPGTRHLTGRCERSNLTNR